MDYMKCSKFSSLKFQSECQRCSSLPSDPLFLKHLIIGVGTEMGHKEFIQLLHKMQLEAYEFYDQGTLRMHA